MGGEAGDVGPEDVLSFWFVENPMEKWFAKDADFDAAIRDRFAHALAAAKRGDLDGWASGPRGALALVILLDQFSRNLHRDDPRAFEADAKARDLAKSALWRGWDRRFASSWRVFFYMPLEHSETVADQVRCCALMETTGNDRWVEYAHRHRVIVERFGRFPHRNACLGRESTAEEIAFLKEPNSSF